MPQLLSSLFRVCIFLPSHSGRTRPLEMEAFIPVLHVVTRLNRLRSCKERTGAVSLTM